MFSQYNKAIEAGIGTSLMVGIVVLGFLEELPPAIVIGVTAALAVLTTFKTYWVTNHVSVPTSVPADVVTEDRVHDAVEVPDWRDGGPGRHQRPRNYRAVNEVPAPRAVSRMRDES